MERLAGLVSGLSRWRRAFLAFGVGAVSVLSMAPFHVWPVLLVTLPCLVWLLDGVYDGASALPSRRAVLQAALTGWSFGFGYFLAGLYWVGHAFLVEADKFAWLLPFAVALLPAGLALFHMAAAVIAGPLWRPGPARLAGLALAFGAGEWLRGHVLTGFPWNLIGYAVAGGETMMQWASVFGVYGLTVLAVAVFSAPAAVWAPQSFATRRAALRVGYPLAMAVILASAAGFGQWRLQTQSTGFVEGVRVRIVQPNIPQEEKWKPENRAAIFQRYLNISRGAGPDTEGLEGISHLIWPESALPFLLADTGEALAALAELLPEGTTFITGAARAGQSAQNAGPRDGTRIYNSLFVMNDRARILDAYDKAHLVPFGEYLPFQKRLESLGLEQLTGVRGGFAEGDGPRLMRAPGVPPFVALICYEIIFPDAIREPSASPGWLLNVTNDAWFGDSTGPYQHFHQARVRAVEQGLPLVRAANTGITAVVDPYGRVLARLPRKRAGALDSALARAAPSTPYVRWGGAIFITLCLVFLAAWAALAFLVRTRECSGGPQQRS